ncbi:peptidoglycan-binding protein [Streptomyces sp. NPDC051041]|uniref:peptidoglycan-binding protein n=1 Tax=Streptomyces sp. NPDC051041 TaxID=3365640 RepID=UPI0037936C9E
MRALTRTLVSVTAAAGIAAGTLAGAGTAFADSPRAQQQAVRAEAAPLAVNNLGLTTAEAKEVQRWLKAYWGYTGKIDGQLGTSSWKAFQRCLKTHWGYTGKIDGLAGEGTIKALQRLLKNSWGYTGAIDGKAGSGTKKAFKRFANGV